jgi:hypothetical protein
MFISSSLELLSHPLYGWAALKTDNHSPVHRPIRVSREPAQASAEAVAFGPEPGVRADTVRYYEREGLLRRHVAEIETETARLAALRAELLGMLAAIPGARLS